MTIEATGGQGISADQRACFAGLADEMIPSAPTMPSATGADAHRSGLDAVLRARPDLLDPLRAALDDLGTSPAYPSSGSALGWIRSGGHEDSWGVLSTVVVAAYFLNPLVCAALGYPGQQAIPVDQQPDDIDPQQLDQVRERGPVYRPTPRG
jgi:hypothetical protein